MTCQITNNSNLEIEGFEDMIQSLVSFSQDRFGFEKPPSLFLNSDSSNAENPLGKTAYYDPQSHEIHIYVDGRHPKDIMRSISHELVHHKQNCDGELDGNYYHGEGYAQKDNHMRDMEKQAYLNGNMCFRDWEDGYKQNETIYNEWRNKQMSLKEWKNNELFGLLADKWGFGKNLIKEGLYEEQLEASPELKFYKDYAAKHQKGPLDLNAHVPQEDGKGGYMLPRFARTGDFKRVAELELGKSYEEIKNAILAVLTEKALDRAIRLGKNISPSQGDEGNYIIDLETYIKDNDPKNLNLSDDDIIKDFVAVNGGGIIKEEQLEEEELNVSDVIGNVSGEPGGEKADLAGIKQLEEESEDEDYRHKKAAMDDFAHIAKLHRDLVYDTYKKHEDDLLGHEDDGARHDDAEYDDATHIDDLKKDAHYDADHDKLQEMISNIVKEILNERK